MKYKKAQTAVELIIVTGFLMFFFVMFLGAIQNKMYQKSYEKKDIVMRDVVKNIQVEINLALQSTDGYYREFNVSEKIINDDYGVSIFDGVVYANTTDSRHAIALEIPEVIGNVNKGTNVIRKQNGEIYLNS